MDSMIISNSDVRTVGPAIANGNAAEVESYGKCVEDILKKVNQLEQKVNDVEQFYSTKDHTPSIPAKCSSIVKDKVKDKHIPTVEKHQLDTTGREGAAAKRMQELMRHFGTIFRQITQHKWAWPFMQPVDVEGLELHDYYKVIKKPMDLGTIKSRMESKDGTGYNNVRDIYADVRLVFKNAMTYNGEKDDVYVMAKTLLEKFEEKWLQLLPKVAEEEKKQAEEEVEARLSKQLAQEMAHANMARDLSNELYEFDMQLEKLREMVVQTCRKMSTEEKKKLGTALTRLSPEDLSRALEIVAENNPSFQATAQEVDLDIDAQSELTLWRLKVFMQESLKVANKNTGRSNNDNNKNNSKRRREICDALNKTAIKRTKKA